MATGGNELDLDTDAVVELLRARYGLEPLAVVRLESELSTVSRVDLASGRVLAAKATHRAPGVLEATQWRVAATERLADAGLPVGRAVPDREGRPVPVAETPAGGIVLHLSEWLSGVPLLDVPPTPELLRDVGRTAATVARGLAGHPPPPVPIAHPWELVRTLETLEEALPRVADASTRHLAEEAAGRFRRSVLPRLDRLPHQVVHHDLHDSNLLVDGARVTGVLDFGDMVVGPRVAELAVAAAYASRTAADPVAALLHVAEGWGRTVRLTDDEIEVVLDAGIGRLAVNAAVWASRRDSARGAYARARSATTQAALGALLAAERIAVQAGLRGRLAVLG